MNEDVSPIKNGGFSIAMLVYQRVYIIYVYFFSLRHIESSERHGLLGVFLVAP